MNDLDSIAPVTGRSWNSSCPQDNSSGARCRLQLCCGIRFVRKFQRLLPLVELILCSHFVFRPQMLIYHVQNV